MAKLSLYESFTGNSWMNAKKRKSSLRESDDIKEDTKLLMRVPLSGVDTTEGTLGDFEKKGVYEKFKYGGTSHDMGNTFDIMFDVKNIANALKLIKILTSRYSDIMRLEIYSHKWMQD